MSLAATSDPLTLPTWLTAIFTGVLALFAVVTAVFAILRSGSSRRMSATRRAC
jgi:hypothetical protein